ncbi:TadE/TadG family type IV pilus assembly protein [Aliiroseovarius sp. PrR006]|uniref:TadE/TadG family type IV pilus assembly protein n=1 Tax=Aliiroseovarius sp. PrR006 TaxID=2706883 RepID=UPI0013D2C249|nr:TadE family protein [Aliiroseovarius sp. PrR006]NDW54208.1 pilus assembly protein [Aliiroseovarius sp. PrR006]
MNEDGTATVETVLWLPALFMIFILIVNASFVFYKQSIMMRVIQDANRALSVGRIGPVDDLAAAAVNTQAYVEERISGFASNGTVKTTVNPTTRVITTTASVPISDLIFNGKFNLLTGFSITAQSQHFVEY